MDKLTAEKFFKDSHELSDVALSAKGVISISQALDLMELYHEAKIKEHYGEPTDYKEESTIANMMGKLTARQFIINNTITNGEPLKDEFLNPDAQITMSISDLSAFLEKYHFDKIIEQEEYKLKQEIEHNLNAPTFINQNNEEVVLNPLSQLSFADLFALYQWNGIVIDNLHSLSNKHDEDFKNDLKKAIRSKVDIRRELNTRTEQITGLTL